MIRAMGLLPPGTISRCDMTSETLPRDREVRGAAWKPEKISNAPERPQVSRDFSVIA